MLIENAWIKFSAGAMTQLLTEVSSRLLDFVLELSENFTEEVELSKMKEMSKELNVSDLFNNAVFGDNATVIVGNSNTQNVKNSIVTNNLDSLIATLKKHNISDEDLHELTIAIDEDKSDPAIENGRFGERVSSWLGNMVSKAASTAWQIEIGIAGSLLANALTKYYGF